MADSEPEISKEELQKQIEEILYHASLDKISTKKVIQQLEQKLGVDLSKKKTMIDQMVMDYVNDMESEDEGSMDDEEEVPAPPPKAVKKSKKQRNDDDDDEENDDSNDSDWGSGGKKKKVEEKKKKAAPKSKKEKAKKGGGGVTKRRKGSGYTKACKLSPALAELMGESELPRHEVVKRVWAIIKEKQLFDPKNRQFAICDKALFKVIGEESFHTFSMMKYLKNHFLD
ncbi:upstream activation factor subunit spp27 [Helicoverpa zea]|uniref:upstream activation factor subunit spp27 n=1 Tax=Helicoverpa zea TaxID=7113 RepID=UPI001F57E0C1|nr:upstream activation factor subunit spp27 [Helicoverpa zea]